MLWLLLHPCALLFFARTACADEGEQLSMLQLRTGADGKFVAPEAGQGKKTECAGQTVAGKTAWSQLNPNQICTVIDTSSCEFTGEPVYFPSIGGSENHDRSYGASVVVESKKASFKVCAGYEGISVKSANGWKWHINWVGYGTATKQRAADTHVCYRRGWDRQEGKIVHVLQKQFSPAHGNWQLLPGTKQSLYVDVDTRSCGFTETPIYIARFNTDQAGYNYVGQEAVSLPTASGFRFIVHALPDKRTLKPDYSAKTMNYLNGYRFNSVHLIAVGKAAQKTKYPRVGFYVLHGWSTKFTGMGWYFGFQMIPKKKMKYPIWMLSMNSARPMWWNASNTGMMSESQSYCTKMRFDNPKLFRADQKTHVFKQQFLDLLKDVKINIFEFEMQKGLPTPPPTPPTPLPTPAPTPPTPPTPPPTPAPTPAPTRSTPQKECCCKD